MKNIFLFLSTLFLTFATMAGGQDVFADSFPNRVAHVLRQSNISTENLDRPVILGPTELNIILENYGLTPYFSPSAPFQSQPGTLSSKKSPDNSETLFCCSKLLGTICSLFDCLPLTPAHDDFVKPVIVSVEFRPTSLTDLYKDLYKDNKNPDSFTIRALAQALVSGLDQYAKFLNNSGFVNQNPRAELECAQGLLIASQKLPDLLADIHKGADTESSKKLNKS